MAYKLLWLDLESTGLDYGDDPILEIGVVVTGQDYPWAELATYHAVCHPVSPEWKSRMNDYVFGMHTINGLISDVEASDVTLRKAEVDIISILAQHGRPGNFKLAGSGVSHYDMDTIRAQMPELAKWLTYSMFDVSPTRTMFSYAGRPDLVRSGITFGVGSAQAHRALDDICDHLAEARAYAEMIRSLPTAP